MELIRISQTKLKIMLSAEDVQRFEFTTDEGKSVPDGAALRNILKEARSRCGFDAVGDRVFVQYYPDALGGCEMFVTKLSDENTEKKREETSDRKSSKGARKGESRYDSGYIIYSFGSMGHLLLTCKALSAAGYNEESFAYRIEDKCRYYLVLVRETYHAAENNGVRCDSSFYYVLEEHGEMFCDGAVDKIGNLV